MHLNMSAKCRPFYSVLDELPLMKLTTKVARNGCIEKCCKNCLHVVVKNTHPDLICLLIVDQKWAWISDFYHGSLLPDMIIHP